MYFPNFYKNPASSAQTQPDVEMGQNGNAKSAHANGDNATNDTFSQGPHADGSTPAQEPAAGLPGPRRLFTRAMSRQTMLGGAAGLVTGAVISGIYGGVSQAHGWANLQASAQSQSLINLGATPFWATSPGAIAGIMIGLPVAGAAIAAGIKTYRFRRGVDDADTTSPAPAERESFWTKRLGVKCAIGAGVGLVLGGIASGAAAFAVKQVNDLTYRACWADYNNVNLAGQQGTPTDCNAADGTYDEDGVPHIANDLLGAPVAAIVCSMLFLPVACAAIEMGRNALQHDWRKRQ